MIAVQTMTAEDVRELFRRISTKEEPHGEFMTAFAWAILRADDENFAILLPAALRLICKYRLGQDLARHDYFPA